MEELVKRIAAATGLDPSVAGKAVTVILRFLAAEAPPDKVKPLIAAIPGAAEATAGAQGPGGIMGVFNQLTGVGLGMNEVQAVARAFVAYAREKAGGKAVDDVVASIPGLSQVL